MNQQPLPLRKISPLAGKIAPESLLVNIPQLITAYYTEIPDPAVTAQRVSFGTSGHRGCSFDKTFNEWHILAITQAIVSYRAQNNINGPLFLGIDTHAVSIPALASALEVLAANQVEVMIAGAGLFTPTPVISHAILCYNHGRKSGLADGIVITPSHNPPQDGGFKYNPPHGGPAGPEITGWIENQANELLTQQLQGIKRMPLERALKAATTHEHDFINHYLDDLANVIDMPLLRDSGLRMAVDPLGGAGVQYWAPLAERYGLNLTVLNSRVDPTFRFMSVDWDGQIRMDPSSPYAMAPLIAEKDHYDITFACDTDHDRHGIIAPSSGLLPPNHYLTAAVYYLFQYRPQWRENAAVGKTLVSSQMIDRVAASLGRRVYEVPVGFKWFVEGLRDGSLGFGGEESAGATFLRFDTGVWTTDKDGIIPALLSAEITARLGQDPGTLYGHLENQLGKSSYERMDAPATLAQKALLGKLSAQQVQHHELAGEPIQSIQTHATGNGAAMGGLKVNANSGWFAARPSGTENIYKIYAESFQGQEHLRRIMDEAQNIVNQALGSD